MNKKTIPLWELEETARRRGFGMVCGCDEAGETAHGPVDPGAGTVE